MRVTQKRNHHLRYALVLWAIIIVLALIVTVLREIGWIIATAVIAALAYRAGQKNVITQTRNRTRKIRANSQYGRNPQQMPFTEEEFLNTEINPSGKPEPWPGQNHDSYAWEPSPSSPADTRGGPVWELDAVSPYPPGMASDEENERVTGTLRAVQDDETKRARLLRDKLGGVHNLFGDDDNA
jgi:hypothetical protein